MSFFDIIARMRLDASPMRAGLRQANADFKSFEKGLKSALASGFIASVVKSTVMALAEQADRVKALGEIYGLTTDFVQRFSIAAVQSGKTFEGFAKVFAKIQRDKLGAIGGDMDAVKEMEKLGLTLREAQDPTATLEDTLRLISERVKSGAMNARDFSKAMGEIGFQAAPFLSILEKSFGVQGVAGAGAIQNVAGAKSAVDAYVERIKAQLTEVLSGFVSLASVFHNAVDKIRNTPLFYSLSGPSSEGRSVSLSDIGRSVLKRTSGLGFIERIKKSVGADVDADANIARLEQILALKKALPEGSPIGPHSTMEDLIALRAAESHIAKSFSPLHSDALARVGGFVGVGKSENIPREQLHTLRRIHDRLKEGLKIEVE